MILGLTGHLGSTADALIDGQLSPPDEERAWGHVAECAACERLVTQQGWAKRRVGSLGVEVTTHAPAMPAGLLGNLYAADGWAATLEELSVDPARRRVVAMALGGGALGVAVLSLLMLSSPPAGLGERTLPRSPSAITSALPAPAVSTDRQRDLLGDGSRTVAISSPR